MFSTFSRDHGSAFGAFGAALGAALADAVAVGSAGVVARSQEQAPRRMATPTTEVADVTPRAREMRLGTDGKCWNFMNFPRNGKIPSATTYQAA